MCFLSISCVIFSFWCIGLTSLRSLRTVKDERDFPNVRTLNTLLRGCLWTAASEYVDGDGNRKLAGGIVTSKSSWDMFHTCASEHKKTDPSVGFDCSSYEYYIAQLCYSLRVDEANDKLDELRRLYTISFGDDGKFEDSAVEPSVMESLAVSLVALARAMALLMRHDQAAATARSALNAIEIAKRLVQEERDGSSHRLVGSVGGKRSWKKRDDGNGEEAAQRRAISNSLFRSHRLSEAQSEASHLLKTSLRGPAYTQPGELAFHLMTRLLYFSGGGTTEMSPLYLKDEVHRVPVQDDPLVIRCQLMTALWHSFGLREALKLFTSVSDLDTDMHCFGEQDLSRVQEAVGMTTSSAISDDGFIDFQQVFRSRLSEEAASSYNTKKTSHNTERRPLDIELGSGFGDWIVDQAISNPSRDYVAVELRSDRVAQTFSKAFLNGSAGPLNNLCCVGSECGSFLRQRVRHGTVSTIFVNHPEPPTQTYGSNNQILMDIAKGGSEPAHMLNSETLISASKCLNMESRGKLIIVTDNRWYARLICATLAKVMKLCKGIICTSDLGGQLGIRHIETFGKSRDRVILYEGQPSQAIRHSAGNHTQPGSSYFDRLWRSGAGTHAEWRARFIISIERAQDVVEASPQTSRNNSQPHLHARKGIKGGKKNRKNKKSDAKQKRRNERRLLKKKGEIPLKVDE